MRIIEKERFKCKKLKDVTVNECFTAMRKGKHRNEMGYYLKLNATNPSKFFKFISLSASPIVAAINLETGCVRFFAREELEQPVRVFEIEYE